MMSEIRTHDIVSLVTLEGKFCTEVQPGDMVRFYMFPDSLGTVVEKISNNQIKVLWSNLQGIFYPSTPRGINYSEIGRKLFTVEPLPQGAIPFYLDHMCKDVKD